jgi:hypothetical protein
VAGEKAKALVRWPGMPLPRCNMIVKTAIDDKIPMSAHAGAP